MTDKTTEEQKLTGANFKSRIFGIFSEEIVRIWLKNPKCKYEDLGRPTLYDLNDTRLAQLDFTFRDRETNKIYIVEQKCFYGYRKGKMATISTSDDFIKNFESWSTRKMKQTKAWECFINFPKNYHVKVQKEKKHIDGRILIWAKYEEDGKKELIKNLKINDIISIEEIIKDLNKWQDKDYFDFIRNKKNLINELFKTFG
jgi:hypothetical protein